jgi:hypothetical protein
MWMRSYVKPLPAQELGGAHLIKENERSDHPATGCRQSTSHFKPAQVPRPWNNNSFNGVNRVTNRNFRI